MSVNRSALNESQLGEQRGGAAFERCEFLRCFLNQANFDALVADAANVLLGVWHRGTIYQVCVDAIGNQQLANRKKARLGQFEIVTRENSGSNDDRQGMRRPDRMCRLIDNLARVGRKVRARACEEDDKDGRLAMEQRATRQRDNCGQNGDPSPHNFHLAAKWHDSPSRGERQRLGYETPFVFFSEAATRDNRSSAGPWSTSPVGAN